MTTPTLAAELERIIKFRSDLVRKDDPITPNQKRAYEVMCRSFFANGGAASEILRILKERDDG